MAAVEFGHFVLLQFLQVCQPCVQLNRPEVSHCEKMETRSLYFINFFFLLSGKFLFVGLLWDIFNVYTAIHYILCLISNGLFWMIFTPSSEVAAVVVRKLIWFLLKQTLLSGL